MRTILVIDDEELVCNLACAILKASGYRVLTASNAQMAKSLLRENAGDISLVLLDAGMAGVVPDIDPKAALVLSSGLLQPEPGTCCFLQKPYSAARLRAVVCLALQRHPLAA